MVELIAVSVVFGIFIAIIGSIAFIQWKTAEPFVKGCYFLATGFLLSFVGLLWVLFLEYRYYEPATIGFISALFGVGLILLAVGARKMRRPKQINTSEWTTGSAS
jgi:hypothetical protein